MIRKFTFWFWVAIVMQGLTGVFHSLSLFVSPQPANETEIQMISLMTSYKIDAGAGCVDRVEIVMPSRSGDA